VCKEVEIRFEIFEYPYGKGDYSPPSTDIARKQSIQGVSCRHAKDDAEVRGVALPLTSSFFLGSLRLPLKIREHAIRLSHEQQIENQKLPRRGRLSAKLMTQLRPGFGQRIEVLGTE